VLPASAGLELEPEGEVWVVRYAGRELRFPDLRGLRMLARLVAEPGRAFHALELAHPDGLPGDAVIDAGDAGEVIDAEARRAYRRRAADLRETLEEAEAWNDPGRAAAANEELAALERELARAVGLGGRLRTEGAAAERARVNVRRRLKDALDRIAAQDADLGRHLAWAVRTGMTCVYEPG
jgi:hypothetical protein